MARPFLAPLPPPPARWALLLLGLVFLRGLMLMGALPAMEGWDEYQHLARIDYLDRVGASPLIGQSTVPPAFLRRVVAYPQPPLATAQLAAYGARTYAAYWADPAADTYHDGPPMDLYQAQHPPGYYRLALPIYRALGGADHLVAAADALRLLNLLFMVAAVGCCILAFRELFPHSAAWFVAGAAAATHPLFLSTGVRVANDALSILAASLLLWLAARLARAIAGERPWRWSLPVLIGLIAGASIWTKTTTLALLPILLLIPLLVGHRAAVAPAWPRRLTAGALIALPFLALAAPYLLDNLHRYGVPVPMYESVQNHLAGKGAADLLHTARHINWFDQLRDWWFGPSLWMSGWSFRLASHTVRWFLYEPLLLVGMLLALARSLGFLKTPPLTRRALGFSAGVCLCFSLALAFHAVQSALFRGAVSTNPVYAATAWPYELLLVLIGFAALRPPLARSCTAALLAVCFFTEFFATALRMPLMYAATRSYPLALHRMAALHTAPLGMPTFLAAAALTLLLGLCVLARVLRTPLETPGETQRD